MEFAAVEPADCGLAPARIHPNDAVLRDAGIMADRERGGVHKADASTGSQLRLEVDGERQHDARYERDEAGVAEQVRELSTHLRLDILHGVQVEVIEGAVPFGLTETQDRHERAGTQAGRPLAMALAGSYLFALPQRRKRLPEGIHRAV